MLKQSQSRKPNQQSSHLWRELTATDQEMIKGGPGLPPPFPPGNTTAHGNGGGGGTIWDPSAKS